MPRHMAPLIRMKQFYRSYSDYIETDEFNQISIETLYGVSNTVGASKAPSLGASVFPMLYIHL